MSEALLPPEILAKADFRHNEYAWRIADLPEVIEAAKVMNLLNLGGQLQIRTPDAIGECDWIDIDVCKFLPEDLPWDARVRMAAQTALSDLEELKANTDFAQEISEAFPEPIAKFTQSGGKVEDAIWFVWYADSEST
jgi:ABC-type amino acid transport substrate-binding protein